MIFNFILIFLSLFIIFTFLLDYYNYAFDNDRRYPEKEFIETFQTLTTKIKQKIKEFKSRPKKTPITYEEQYKYDLNPESKNSFVFYEQDICKNIKNDNVYSLTNELNCSEMKKYLKIIKEKTNDKEYKIDAKTWKEKEVVTDQEYKLEKSKQNHLNLISFDDISNTIDILINNFVKSINTHFENSEFFKKYNKHHPFSPYLLERNRIIKYYEYRDLQRVICEVKLHRTHKIHDFIINIDIFYNKNKQILYYNNILVRGITNRFNTPYLEPDDTSYDIKYVPIITKKMNAILETIETKKNISGNEKKYKDIVSLIEKYNLNKSFNEIIYYEILKLIRIINIKLNNNNNEKKYKIVLDLFIENTTKLLYSKSRTTPGLSKNIRKDKSKLEGKLIFNNELQVAFDKMKKHKKLSFDEYSRIKFKELKQKYKCYHPLKKNEILQKYDNKIFCESYHKDIDAVGVWDKDCEKDSECPFFKANTNYPNDYGGCIEGRCQLPIGMSLIGGTKASKLSNPVCHNCKGDGIHCCNEQSKNKKITPDYAFEKDKILRQQHKSILLKLGLKP